jgi:hypothetical protein
MNACFIREVSGDQSLDALHVQRCMAASLYSTGHGRAAIGADAAGYNCTADCFLLQGLKPIRCHRLLRFEASSWIIRV